MVPASSSLAGRHDNRWFPPWFIWPLFFLTSSIRVYYVMQPHNWWIVHPDEIYQTLEVAHSEVYGYGFRTYEFNSEPTIDELTPNSLRNEAQHGLWALRSHLLPHAYVTVTWLLGILGMDFPPFITWKVFHTLAASALVPAVYLYVSVVFRSRDTACLAAIFCAACCQLTVLGTHTLVNSLVAPPVFLALTHLHTLVSPPDIPGPAVGLADDKPPDSDASHTDDTARKNTQDEATTTTASANSSRKISRGHPASNSGEGRPKFAKRSVGSASKSVQASCNGAANSHKNNNVSSNSSSIRNNNRSEISAKNNDRVVGNNNKNHTIITDMGENAIRNESLHITSSNNHKNGDRSGVIKPPHRAKRESNGIAAVVTTTDALVHNGSTKLPHGHTEVRSHSTVSANSRRDGDERGVIKPTLTVRRQDGGTANTAAVLNSCTKRPRSRAEDHHRCSSPAVGAAACSSSTAAGRALFLLRDLTAGLTLGVCVYVRMDVVALVAVTTLAHWRPFRARYLRVVLCACGALAGVGLGVSEDFRCYGWGVLTPCHWFRFNVQNDYASLLFGRHAFHKYVVDIVFLNVGTTALAAVACLSAASRFLGISTPAVDPSRRQVREVPRDKLQGESKGADVVDRKSAVPRNLLSWLALLLLYSSKGHKELRFVHNVIVLMLITCADVIHSALTRRGGRHLSRGVQRRAVYAGVVFFALSQWHDVASLTDDPRVGGNKMALSQAGDTQDVNRCLHFISGRSDVTGVFIDRSLYATGGYSILHRDVPVFAMFATNFHEYSVGFRWTEPAKTVFSRRGSMSVSYVGRFSNYLSWHNARYAIKFVVQDPRYNYLVVKTQNDFSVFGFDQPVFHCGTYKVLKRPTNPTRKQATLFQNTISMPPLSNASLLMHEADMLFYHGAWARASERFRDVLQVDSTQVGVYLPLAASLYRLGDEAGSAAAIHECYFKFSEEACERRRLPMVTNFASSNSYS